MNLISKHRYLLILIALFIAQFLFISPSGEFPLNDDWVHIEMIKHWIETGEFRMNPFTGPLLFFPIIYGAILTKIFGFSFLLFRLSTLMITFFLTLGIFLFLRKKTENPALSFFAAVTIWLNPIIYNLSFTFMTDIPALALLFAAIFCFNKGQEKNDWRYLFFGSVAAILGFYTRQTNILILAAFGLFALFDSRLRSVKNIAALGMPALFGAGIYWFLGSYNLLPEGGALHAIEGKRALAEHIFLWFWYTILYVGLFTLPLTITVLKNNWKEKKYLLFSLFGFLIPVILFLWRGELFPYVPNIINNFGLGPLSDVLRGEYIPLFGQKIQFIISLVSGFGAGLLAATLAQKKIWRENVWLCIFCGIFLAPILILSSFDRYFLPLLLGIVIIFARELKNIKLNFLSFAVFSVMAFYSITQTHFYLNWNRTRAELVQTALANENIRQNNIDGGYEWTGWLGYWEAQKTGIGRGPENAPWWIKFLITNNTAEYAVSATPLADYFVTTEKTVPGRNPNNRLFLLKRNQ